MITNMKTNSLQETDTSSIKQKMIKTSENPSLSGYSDENIKKNVLQTDLQEMSLNNESCGTKPSLAFDLSKNSQLNANMKQDKDFFNDDFDLDALEDVLDNEIPNAGDITPLSSFARQERYSLL